MASKIRDVENKYPAFSIIVNLLYFTNQKDKSNAKISEIVKNVFGTEKVIKTDEQIVRNIIESISAFGVDYYKNYPILKKDLTNLAETTVNKDVLIDYLFEMIGEYFLTGIESADRFYNKIKINNQKPLKKIIRLYLDYMSFKPKSVCEMTFSDAIVDIEQLIFLVSERKEIMNKIKDTEVKSLIKEWSDKIRESFEQEFKEKPPFVEDD